MIWPVAAMGSSDIRRRVRSILRWALCRSNADADGKAKARRQRNEARLAAALKEIDALTYTAQKRKQG